MMKVKIKKLNMNAIIPTKGSSNAAGMDLYACTTSPIVIAPHQTVDLRTGLVIEIPKGYFGAIIARNGFASKNGLRPANCVGVHNEDYEGECIVSLHNDTDIPQLINPMERIAQLIIIPYLSVEFEECEK